MSLILSEQHGAVMVLRLNRPDKFNSFTRAMAMEMQQALDACAADSIRAVVITGNGKAFCAGQDLQEVTGPDAPGFKTILSEGYNPIVSKIRGLKKPVIAVVNGVAAGAGANIALCCDVVIAASSASFIQAFSKIGLVPDSGGTFTLPRLIGFQKASALMMLGEKVSAAQAEQLGMIYQVIEDAAFEDAWMALANTLAAMPTHGLALTKQLLNDTFTNTFEQQLALEEKYQIEAGHTDDYREGVNAFVEKRKPVFTGK
jgi:2-(1,2-epoxy-1,2-dihydrophenyl)acetyl-CoA isomerase